MRPFRSHQRVDKVKVSLGLRITNIGVLAQNAAQVSASLVSSIAEQVMRHLKRNIALAVDIQGAGDFIVSRSDWPRPEYFRRLQSFVCETGDQQHSQDRGQGI